MAPPAQLPLRKVGKDGPLVPVPALGLMGLGNTPGAPAAASVLSDEARLAVLDRAWELGCTTWDTADKYGDSEELVGKWLRLHPERRDDVFLATKFGMVYAPPPGGKGFPVVSVDASPEYCRAACERSLERLGVGCIDLFYLHRVSPDVPVEKTMRAMVELQREGKIKHIGISAPSSTSLRRACAVAPVSAVQVEYSPWTLDVERESGMFLLRTCRELGVAVFTYSPLGKGMLTGKLREPPQDVRRFLPRLAAGETFDKNLALVGRFVELAGKKGCTPAQLALAWAMAQGEDVIPIPGTRSVKYLEENVGAAKVALEEAEVKELRAYVDACQPAGEQIPPGFPVRNYGDTPALES